MKCGKLYNRDIFEDEKIDSCKFCENKSFYFDKVISCVSYDELSKKLIFNLKYKRDTYLSGYVAQIMAEKLEIENIKFDYIISVPLSKHRFRKRGFNQSEKIAKYLSKYINIPNIDAIKRIRNTKVLYKLDNNQRKRELKNAFELKNDNEAFNIDNKNILLIDDIFTTGSTVNEISKVLKLNKVNKIYILTFLSKNKNV